MQTIAPYAIHTVQETLMPLHDHMPLPISMHSLSSKVLIERGRLRKERALVCERTNGAVATEGRVQGRAAAYALG